MASEAEWWEAALGVAELIVFAAADSSPNRSCKNDHNNNNKKKTKNLESGVSLVLTVDNGISVLFQVLHKTLFFFAFAILSLECELFGFFFV